MIQAEIPSRGIGLYAKKLKSFYVGHTVKLYMRPFDEEPDSDFSAEDIVEASFEIKNRSSGTSTTLTLGSGDILLSTGGRYVAYYLAENPGYHFVIASVKDSRDITAVDTTEFEVVG